MAESKLYAGELEKRSNDGSFPRDAGKKTDLGSMCVEGYKCVGWGSRLTGGTTPTNRPCPDRLYGEASLFMEGGR